MSIGCIAIWVRDLDRSRRFYCEGLGLDVISIVQTSEVREVIVGRKDLGSQLMLAHRVGEKGTVSPSGFWKTYLSSDDLTGDIARGVPAGATVSTEPTFMEQFNITIAVLADPDGYLLELGQLH